MSGFKFNLEPKEVPIVNTKYRKIKTALPHPESINLFSELDKYESTSMHGQLPVIWDKASGIQVEDPWGNKWLDFTSTIFVANAGHGNPKIVNALQRTLKKPLLHTYTYAHKERVEYLKYLIENTPKQFEKAFMLSAGTEATECALKLIRMNGQKNSKKKGGIICISGNWHGRTLGAQMLCSLESQKEWIGSNDPNIHHISFPYPWLEEVKENSVTFFENEIKKLLELKNINPDDLCGFILETFQGWGAVFYPKPFVKAVESYAKKNNMLLAFDEMQSGFGRTGTLFGYENYDVKADLLCLGKGASSSLPLSIVLGSKEVMDLPDIGSMSSTHSANPMVCAAGLANMKCIIEDGLIENSKTLGEAFHDELNKLKIKNSSVISDILGKGLLAAIHFNDENRKPLSSIADKVAELCMQKGLLVVHTGRETIKLAPPLVINKDALMEGINVLDESITEVLSRA